MQIDAKIQKWFLENEPSDDMRYKEIWWKNNVFIRDRILCLFNSKEAEVIGLKKHRINYRKIWRY
jgi:hypothetical protein